MAKDFLFLLTLVLFWSLSTVHAFDVVQEAKKQEWLDRLFYIDGKSLVTNDSFFVSKNGRYDPYKELQETVEILRRGDFALACKFPGRFSYLASRMGIDTKSIYCEEFESWRESYEADGISLMFASQYLENPASSFGHTYLKINSNKKSLYLNKVISFAATVPKDVGAGEYVWKGLTGGFPGAFNEGPFYILFQEYANMEKRDIWEYELNVTPSETRHLLAILYEVIYQAKFDYLFLSDNCSSLLLRLIDIQANKSLHQSLPFYIIPIETVKALEEKGMVKRAIFHPSITSRMSLQSQKMNSSEIHDFVNYIENDKKLSSSSTTATLDLSLEYLNFLRQKNAGILPDDKKKDFDQYLVMRSQRSEEFHKQTENVPDPIKASNPQRLSLGVQGINHDPLGFALTYRPVGKDFYDRPNGYAKESEINFLKTKIYLDTQETRKSWFNLDIIGIRKFSDFNSITRDYSWGGNLSVENLIRQGCSECYFTQIDSHLGLGKNIFENSVLSYLVVHPTIRFGNISHKTNLLPQIEGGIIKSMDHFIFKTSAFHGVIYDGYDKKTFNNMKTSCSLIMSDEVSLNLNYEYFYQAKSWNSWEAGISYYF